MKIILTSLLLLVYSTVYCQLNEELLKKQRMVESSGSHKAADGSTIQSHKGALGIAQFMPSTWDWMKSEGLIPEHYNIHDEKHQVEAQKIYMTYLYNINYGIEDDKTALAAASYQAGVNRVLMIIKAHQELWRDHIPDSTKDYLTKLNL